METQTQHSREEAVWPPPPTTSLPPTKRLPLTKLEVFWQIVGRATGMGLTRGALCGAGYGLFFYIVGAIYGLFLGGIAGLLMGCVMGFILAFATCGWFYPLRHARTYRRFVGVVSLVVASVPGLLAVIACFGGPHLIMGLWMMVVLPALIAMIAAWTANQRLCEWYESEMRKRGGWEPEGAGP